MELDFDDLTDSMRRSTRERFIAENPGFFLVVSGVREDEDVGFVTQIEEISDGRRVSSSRRLLEVFAVRKNPNNPYSDRISVGRARNCDLTMRDPSLSKLHAHLLPQADGGIQIADLGSQNGTQVNGRRLTPHQAARIAPGDQVQFGTVQCKLYSAGQLYDLFR